MSIRSSTRSVRVRSCRSAISQHFSASAVSNGMRRSTATALLRRQRVPQFVGEHRQEFVFALIGLAQRFVPTNHAARPLGVMEHAASQRFVRPQEQTDVLLHAESSWVLVQ